ncbi:thiol-disulfide oxidoreductase DCC family protein [Algoriphagus lacus]|nr:DUF393 domain-containing protein [Algoriphagus lacus]
MKDSEKSIVLIDGECNFCNDTAMFIIKYDGNDSFRFASQQSELGTDLLRNLGFVENSLSTVVLIKAGKVYTKTSALIEISKDLVGLPKVFVLLRIIPKEFRDFFYGIFSKYRYRLFGKKMDCAIPTLEVRRKFLS